MISVDTREGTNRGGSKELLYLIKKNGVSASEDQLEFGDVAFEGNGPEGKILIGMERKSLHDMLNCIDDARFAAHQRPGMMEMYAKSFLIIEGNYKPHSSGLLMECRDELRWFPCKNRTQQVMYSKLYRYLISVQLSGVIITYSRDLFHTAFNICETYQYFQKKWANHTSLLQTQTLNLPHIAVPGIDHKPSLVLRWAAQLEGIGVKLSRDAERLFKKPIAMAQADEMEWLKIPNVGVGTAKQIVKEIMGWK